MYDYEINILDTLAIMTLNEVLEPMSVHEALNAAYAQKWIEGIETRYQELMRNDV